MLDFLKPQRQAATVEQICDILRQHLDNKVITEAELAKFLRLLENKNRLKQVVKLL